MMRVTDLFLAFPFLVALLVVRDVPRRASRALDADHRRTRRRSGSSSCCSPLFGWMGVARLVRGQVLALKEREFIEASRALGATNRRIIVRHLLPNSIGPILVALTLVGRRRRSSPSRRCRSSASARSPAPGTTSLGNLVGERRRRASDRATGGWPCSRAAARARSRSASTSSATACATPLDPKLARRCRLTADAPDAASCSLRDFRVTFTTAERRGAGRARRRPRRRRRARWSASSASAARASR